MERYTMFIDWMTQGCKDVNSPKFICKLCKPFKISTGFFKWTLTMKFVWKGKGPKLAKTIMKNKNKAERTSTTDI